VKAVWVWVSRRSRATVIGAALCALAMLGMVLVAVEALTVARLEDPILNAPTRIYARPSVLYLGMRPSRELVEDQLRRLGYTSTSGRAVEPGEYRLGSREWLIGQRGFRHHDKHGPGGTAIIRLGYDGRIARLVDGDRQSVTYVALEPELIGSFLGASRKDRIPVRLWDVPDHLVQALLSIEDRRFFEHQGLDLRRIAAATLANLRAGRVVQGASTLTQQLARGLYLSPRRTFIRKLRETAIALALERRYSKEKILEAYLNEVYLGQEGRLAIHGVGRAAQYYFGKDVSALDLSEAATLAALIRGPSLYSPFRSPERARSRRDLVLSRMLECGVISEEAYQEARSAPLDVEAARQPARSVQYFVDLVAEQLQADHGPQALEGGGLAVFTTLDLQLQHAAEEAVRKGLSQLEARYPHLAGQDAPLQAALVALDPRSGEILAMVGGRDYGESQFNRAAKARRQPGSAFKPIVALAALARRGWEDDADGRPFTLASVLHDERLVVQTPEGPWEPANYDERFRGPVSLREALERSLNVPFARLGMEVGPTRIVETAQHLGIGGPLYPVPSIALGSSEVTPLELTQAFGVLAAGGLRLESRTVLAVLDRDASLLERNEPAGVRVYDAAEVYLVTSALRGAVERGTGRGLRALGYRGDVAAKSGTTSNFRDGWFIGYTPALAVGVWVGFDDGRSVGLPGARVALPIFARFLTAAIGRDGDRGLYGGAEFAPPSGLERVEVDPETGLRAGPGCPGSMELFLEGTAPEESCSPFWRVARYRRGGEAWLRAQIARLRDELVRLLERQARQARRPDRFD